MIPGVRKLLDSSLYEPEFGTVTQNELRYALALAKLGSGPRRVRDVAAALDQKVERINWIRNKLIKKEIVYVPASGLVEFRLPLSDKFLLRNERGFARRLG